MPLFPLFIFLVPCQGTIETASMRVEGWREGKVVRKSWIVLSKSWLQQLTSWLQKKVDYNKQKVDFNKQKVDCIKWNKDKDKCCRLTTLLWAESFRSHYRKTNHHDFNTGKSRAPNKICLCLFYVMIELTLLFSHVW